MNKKIREIRNDGEGYVRAISKDCYVRDQYKVFFTDGVKLFKVSGLLEEHGFFCRLGLQGTRDNTSDGQNLPFLYLVAPTMEDMRNRLTAVEKLGLKAAKWVEIGEVTTEEAPPPPETPAEEPAKKRRGRPPGSTSPRAR